MEDRLLRLKEVLEVIPVSRATWYRRRLGGFYPQPEKPGRSSLWRIPPCKKSHRESRKQPTPASSPTLGDVFRPIIRGTDLVFINVCELAFDNIRAPAHFVEQGGCHAAESMRGHLPGKPH